MPMGMTMLIYLVLVE